MRDHDRLESLQIAAGKKQEERTYWLKKLSGELYTGGFPVVPGTSGSSGDSVSFALEGDAFDRLIAISTGSDVRLYIALVSVLTLLLGKYTGSDDVTLGTPVLKSKTRSELINTVCCLRNRLDPEMTFKELLMGVRESVVEADKYRNYPLEVLARELDRESLFNTAILVENIHDPQYLKATGPSVTFSFMRGDTSIRGRIEYDTSRYHYTYMEQLAGHFKNLVKQLSDNPDIKISKAEFLSPGEKQQLTVEFNKTEQDYSMENTIIDLFNRQAEQTPDSVALSGVGNVQLTYKHLEQVSNGWAAVLASLGTKPGQLIGVLAERSLEMIIGILAILKTGCGYVPLNHKAPISRNRFMLSDCNVRLLLTTSDLPAELAEGLETVHLEGEIKNTPSKPVHPLTPSSDQLAYVIYTSGSTGMPKGVAVTHANFSQLIHWGYQLGIGPGDRSLQNLSYYFDWSVWEIFITLTTGAALHMVPDDILLNPRRSIAYMNTHSLTVLHMTPTQYQHIVDAPENPSTLKYLFIGAEKLTYDLAKRCFDSVNETCRVFNMYGPTECTIISAALEIQRKEYEYYKQLSSVPIGIPIGNNRLFILDRQLNLCPLYITGELVIAGGGVTPGYLNNPDLTAGKYIALNRSFGSFRAYKTGDLARWLSCGNVEFLGRIDQQVKIRGFRIELGEIEKRLLEYSDIKDVVVTARNHENGQAFLCVYLVAVPGSALANTESALKLPLQDFLSNELPDYMIPEHFIRLERMPLNPNGKVDLKALPSPEIGVSREYAPPRDETEKRIAELWGDVLHKDISHLGIDDNFFELGGNSLTATTLVHRIHENLEVEIDLTDMFSQPTIRELAVKVRGRDKLAYEKVRPVEKQVQYELSYAQRRLWVLCQFEEDSTAYNIPAAVTLNGSLDVAAFGSAVQALTDRHESLRTIFVLKDGEPFQEIIPRLEVTVDMVDLRHADTQAKVETTRQIFRENANRVFNLETGPLVLFKLVRLEDEEYVVIYNIHHIISDGWSQGNIYNEIIRLYNAFVSGEENPLAPLELQYKDYSCWHNRLITGGCFNDSRQYWLGKFKDKPNGIELPLDHPRKAIQTFNGGRVVCKLERETVEKLHRLCLDNDATLFMGLLTLVNLFLYRYSGQQDIIIGSPIANRKQPELHTMVGFLVNTLVFRNRIYPGLSYRRHLEMIKEDTLACYEYQDFPFDLLVEGLELDRDMSQSPVFNVMLAHNNTETQDHDLTMKGMDISPYVHSEDFNMSKFDLIFFMDEAGGEVTVRIEYNSDLFERTSIVRMAENLQALAADVISGNDRAAAELNILSQAHRRMVIESFNASDDPFPLMTLQELFEQQAGKSVESVAVVFERQIYYSDLNHRANRLAWFLKKEYQVKPNDIIGVSMDRGIDMIVALLGIIKSGAGYLAVDPTYPRDRVLHILADSQANLLVTDKRRERLYDGYEGEIIDVTARHQEIGEKSPDNPPAVNEPNHILYVNYTSGSTGIPNGAMLSHDCLTNLIQWQNRKTTIDCSLRVLQFTSINFCVSFQEIMGTLTSGGELYLIGDVERQDIEYLMNFLSRNRIQVLFLPFSYLNYLFNESSQWEQGFNHDLQHIITAGEQLKITIGLKKFLNENPHLQLHNHYGSTEMHVVTSYTLDALTAEQTPIPPAGRPISNVNIFIVDDQFNPVPVGVWGELVVAGSLEILGYINNKDLTDTKLAYIPGLCTDHKRLYRSGDIGRWLPCGNIELRGRKDFLVKVRGFRVEPGEIESQLLSIEGVRECVVVVKEDSAGQKFLVAYAAADGIDAVEIKRMAGNMLPQYMVPQIMILDSLPLMPNGKVDREQLPEPELDSGREYCSPRHELDEQLVEIWAELLGTDREKIGIDDNFFDLGGHSLMATTMMSHVHKELNVKLDLVEIFKNPTIRDISTLVENIRLVFQLNQVKETGEKKVEILL